ncbi:hypothetical protein [Photobacterium angustum]|uniref:Transcriptional regulator VspR n=1 Tax=Photobacterium angustum TaxID=661 RepID=A0A2S7W309_PHOAN|nr:hypothetical protein [Photobacterium angustum]PQJ68234.1 hypothetical protein BTO08_13035 [Photobacterium angustum]
MKPSKKICEVMYNLLIEKRMDGFSVLEARDILLPMTAISSDYDVARKQVYRKLWQYEQKGWLSTEGKGREKRYFQTSLFHSFELYKKSSSIDERKAKERLENDYSVLLKEQTTYKAELEIVLGEIEQYNSLKSRFPELKDRLDFLLKQAREQSAYLLGKVNGLTKLLTSLSKDGLC